MADNTEAIKNEAGNGEQKKPLEPLPQTATKQYTWTGADGTKINYTATAEMIPVRANDGQLIGHMFMFSQVSDQEDKSDRPVTFCWNGGPGGASYMVNIGGMGAKRVKTDGMAHLKGVGEVEDNPYSLLPSSDLVFIDAFGTGYSHVDPNYDAKKVWGVDGDGDAFTRGIIAWLTKYDRMNSPHYLYGESYGTMRNAVVYRMLGEHGVGVAGITEQSTILDYEPTLSGEDDYYMGMFPVYAATANYFKKAGVGVDQYEWYDKAFDYANNTLARALTLADALPADEMKKIAGEMSEFIGLPADFIEEKGLRIELDTFRKNLLKAEGETTGRYDTRFTTYGCAGRQRVLRRRGSVVRRNQRRLPRRVHEDARRHGLQGLRELRGPLAQGQLELELDASGSRHHGFPAGSECGLRPCHRAASQPDEPHLRARRHPRRTGTCATTSTSCSCRRRSRIASSTICTPTATCCTATRWLWLRPAPNLPPSTTSDMKTRTDLSGASDAKEPQ